MKLNIKEDWNTNTDDNMINAFREIMSNSIDYVNEPYVGIFWYDTENNELFGVSSVMTNEVNPYHSSLFDADVKTCNTLHYQFWKRNHFKGKDKRFIKTDYTSVPRGRVFSLNDDDEFIVCVGSWINDYPEAKQEIIDEFQLPKDKTEFKIDVHWELGHGWSDKLI